MFLQHQGLSSFWNYVRRIHGKPEVVFEWSACGGQQKADDGDAFLKNSIVNDFDSGSSCGVFSFLSVLSFFYGTDMFEGTELEIDCARKLMRKICTSRQFFCATPSKIAVSWQNLNERM